jgi:hypothetical protein
LSKASQDNSISELGAFVGEGVGDDRTERVAQVNNLGVTAAANAGERSLTGVCGEGFESCNLEEYLDLVDGVALGRSADAETVPG